MCFVFCCSDTGIPLLYKVIFTFCGSNLQYLGCSHQPLCWHHFTDNMNKWERANLCQATQLHWDKTCCSKKLVTEDQEVKKRESHCFREVLSKSISHQCLVLAACCREIDIISISCKLSVTRKNVKFMAVFSQIFLCLPFPFPSILLCVGYKFGRRVFGKAQIESIFQMLLSFLHYDILAIVLESFVSKINVASMERCKILLNGLVGGTNGRKVAITAPSKLSLNLERDKK